MCGIAGIITPAGFPVRNLQMMADAIKHRGPDDEGFWLLDENKKSSFYAGTDSAVQLPYLPSNHAFAGFAHRRLSIIDLSAAGHQPMSTSDGKKILTYNGEIYNFLSLKKELLELGYHFKTNSDTEVVLYAIDHWREEAFNKFRGMWALAFCDLEKEEVILSRDRFGIKPLYLTDYLGGLAFSSEIKGILALPGFKPEADLKEISSFIAFGTTEKPFGNLFANICDLHPGHILKIDLQTGERETSCYYSLDQQLKKNYKKKEDNHFEEAFLESLHLHLIADTEIGTCLSGGLDSSAIVAMGTGSGRNFKTITAAYSDPETDESDYAKLVTNSLKNSVEPYFVYPRGEKLWEDFSAMIYHQDLPIGSSSIFAQWCVMDQAGKIGLKVLLNGQGADECLGGYYNFAGLAVLEKLEKFKWYSASKTFWDLRKNFTSNMKVAVARSFFYRLPKFAQKIVRRNQRQGSSLLNPEGEILLKKVKIPYRGGKSFRELSINSLKYGLYELLRYEDRNSMAFSIESRIPFLDHILVEKMIALNTDQKIKNGWTKFPIRRMINGKLPDEVVWRKDKKGFLTPQLAWKNQLLPQILTWLEKVDLPPVLDREKLLLMCNSKLNTPAHQSEFWRIISLVKWWEVFKLEETGNKIE